MKEFLFKYEKIFNIILLISIIGAFVVSQKTYILLFLLILLVLVLVHEFGHFIVAKWTKMRVDEFAFGFPPRLWAKKKGETTYAVNALPIGGYVSIWGENGEPNDEAKTHPRAFGNRPWWAQLLVLVAGVAMNMLLAWIIFISISFGTIEVSTDDPTYGARAENVVLMVADASIDSPAYKAGIVPGSVIHQVVARGAKADITTATSLINFISSHQNDAFLITYTNPNGVTSSTTVAAVYGLIPDKKAIGVSVQTVGTIRTNLWEAIKIGSVRTVVITQMTFEGLGRVLTSAFKGDSVLKELSGPVGIARIVSQTSEYGLQAVLTLVAVLSINLAIFNALPLPALDGGRMVVTIAEAVSRRRIPYKYYSWVNMVGFFALILLLIIVTVNDFKM